MTAVLVLVCLGLAAAGLLAARRWPGPWWLAWRRVRRSRTDSLLVVLGCSVGVAIITGSLLVGDTVEASLGERAPARLGPTDVVVSSYSPTMAGAVEGELAAAMPAGSDGVLRVLTAEATLAVPDGAASPAAGSAAGVVPAARLLEVDLRRARSFGREPAATGVSGGTPGPGEVVLGEDAAEALGIGAGDTVEVYAYGQVRQLTVDRVLPRLGVAGYAASFEAESMNAFVAPGTIDELSYAPGLSEDARPPEHLTFVSGAGGVFEGARRTDSLVEELRNRLEPYPGVEIQPVKQDLLREAEEEGSRFAELFVSLGAFANLAGAALLVSILSALAAGRRRELGTLRALGMRRRQMVATFAFEGALYAALSAVAGAALGILVAGGVVLAAGGALSGSRRGGMDLRLGLEPATLLAGGLSGALISLCVVTLAGVWISRLSVVEALGSEPYGGTAPPVFGRGRFRALAPLAAAALIAASAISVSGGGDPGTLALPAAAVAALAWALLPLARGARRRPLLAGACAVASAWSVIAFPLFGLDATDVTLFVIQGLTLTLAGVTVLVLYQARLGDLIGRLGARVLGNGLVPRLALKYSAERPLRTGATLLTYSLVVFTLVFSSVLSGIFSAEADRLVRAEGGGFDVVATSSSASPVSVGELEAVEGVEAAAPLRRTFADFEAPGGASGDWAISGFDEALLAGGAPALEAYDRGEYASEREVWEAVLENPELAVADIAFLEDGGGPPEGNVSVGDRLRVSSATGGSEREVVAISSAGAAFSGVMVSGESLEDLAEGAVENRHYLALAPGAEPDAVAAGLEREFVASGVEARSFAGVVEEALASQERFFDLIEGYLALGLFVGIFGLGVVMVRAVRERRTQIGILRSLGLREGAVRAVFLVESGAVALQGVALGAGLALATSYQLAVNSSAFDAEVGGGAAFVVPWAQLGGLVLAVLVASVSATVPSATSAARVPPAAALRGHE